DFQMPPAAPAAKNVFDGDGMPTTSDTRPIVFAGPTLRQRKPAMVAESRSNGFGEGDCAAASDALARIARPEREKGRMGRGGWCGGESMVRTGSQLGLHTGV